MQNRVMSYSNNLPKSNAIKRIALLLVMVALILLALSLGRYPISIHEIFLILESRILGVELLLQPASETVIFDIRIPRIMAALLIGTALSVSGVAYQGIFRNPLVSPDILGVSAGAGFGATLAILCSWGSMGIALSAFAFGLLSVLLSYLIGNCIRNSSEFSLVLVLSGMLIGTIFSSMVSFLKCIADPYNKLPAITYWLMGSLGAIKMGDVYIIALPIVLGIIPLWILRWELNLLVFGDEEAQTMGIDTRRLRMIVIICATLLTAAAVSVSGMIGWVGLIIPHLARALVGPNYQKLLPVTILVGSFFLLIVDTLARTLMPMEVPIGILTSLIGAPFFIYLLTHTRRGWK